MYIFFCLKTFRDVYGTNQVAEKPKYRTFMPISVHVIWILSNNWIEYLKLALDLNLLKRMDVSAES